MLQIFPVSWHSWDFRVEDEPRPLADISMNPFRDKGALDIDGETYRAYREAKIFDAFVLEGANGVLARAKKPSIFGRELVILHAGREYSLRPRSMFQRAFVLWQGSKEVGSIAPTSAFTRKAEADLPHDLSVPLRMFIVWLTMISWRRAARATL